MVKIISYICYSMFAGELKVGKSLILLHTCRTLCDMCVATNYLHKHIYDRVKYMMQNERNYSYCGSNGCVCVREPCL